MLFTIVLLALVVLIVRITYINAISGSKYKKQVLSQAQQNMKARFFQPREAIFTIEWEYTCNQQ